ncbi:hypothetical protein R1flu_013676 [Riccia fluitans]|uniref:Monopolin complex subunit Csm1/Pcs1 C-terminal domain-containing protein n=1 Tax=Riccia fluitans TaxID=41844 RepID=A0ABD1YEN8_9MARC
MGKRDKRKAMAFAETQRNDDDRSAKEAASEKKRNNERLQREADKIVANGVNSSERRKVRRRGGVLFGGITMARSKKRARRQSTEVFDFDPVAIAMEAAEEVTRAAIDPTVLDSQEATTGDISPATDPTQPTDNARGVGPNNIQQEDEDLQLIPPNGIPGSVKMDGKLVEPFDPDELERPRKTVRSNPSKKSDVPLPPTTGAEAPTPRKGKEKMAMQPENAFKDEVWKELRELKEAITMSRQEAKAIARSQKETTTRLGQSSAGPSNHMEGTNVRRGPAASLQTKSASMVEYRNTIARMLEECERAVERNTSLEEELVIAQRKIDKLEQRMDMEGEAHLDELSPARDGHVSHNVVDFAIENAKRRLVLTTVHKALSEWREDNLLPGTSFIIGHRLLASDVDKAGVETLYLSICNDFKLVAASHRSPQLFYEHLKSIFDSYVNPDNNPVS